MATWDSLAPELHHIIFSFFCDDIVTQYEDSDLETVLECQLSNISWPTETAQCLIDFSSALCVSRSFHHSLLHFKVGGERVVKILQSAQRERCETILEQIEPEPWYTRRRFIDVRVFMLLGGVFWKNPLVRGDKYFMWSVLSKLSVESLFMLLPHLEEWTHRYAVPGNSNRWGFAMFNLRRDRACRVFDDATFRIGGSGSFSVEDGFPDVKIFTIDGLYREVLGSGSRFRRRSRRVLNPSGTYFYRRNSRFYN